MQNLYKYYYLLILIVISHFVQAQDFAVNAAADPESVCEESSATLSAFPVTSGATEITDLEQGSRPTITIIFASDITNEDISIQKADLKYDKDFSIGFQIDDAINDIITHAFPVFEGGTTEGQQFEGLYYTDGCGNDISFKGSTAHFSWSGTQDQDLHEENGDFYLSWEELETLYQNNWGVYNHGFYDQKIDENYYEVARNHSYTQRITSDEIAYGAQMKVMVNPDGDVAYTQPSLDLGYDVILNQNITTIGDPYLDVNSGFDFDDFIFFRHGIETLSDLSDHVDVMAEDAAGGVKQWTSYFTHSLQESWGYDFDTFVGEYTTVAESYGKNGTDQIWAATVEETYDYLVVRESVEVLLSKSGNTITITLSGDLPEDLRFYALSLLIDSDVVVSSVSVDNGAVLSYNTDFEDNTLINIDWDERVYKSARLLSDEYVYIAEDSQTTNDALIAMDYVAMIDDQITQQYFKSRLCDIPGVDLPDGYCDEVQDYAITWQSNGQTISTDPSVEVTPTETTSYQVTIDNGTSAISESVSVTVFGEPTIDIAEVDVACANTDIQLSAAADNYSIILWSTAGDGVFAYPSLLAPEYTPGSQDVEDGEVWITAYAMSDGCDDVVDSVLLAFNESPILSMEEQGYTCDGVAYDLEVTAENYSTISWSTAGDGYFSTNTGLTTTYMPGQQDAINGSVILSATASSGEPCFYEIQKNATLYIVADPIVDAGEDFESCYSSTSISLAGVASYYSSVSWTSTGSGTFASNGLEATYIPTDLDRTDGFVVFYISADPLLDDCGTTAVDSVEVIILPQPVAYAGEDSIACYGFPFLLEGITENAESVYWTTTGNGTFSHAYSETSYYYPGTYFDENEEVTLTLHALSSAECDEEAVSSITLSQPEMPTIFAGDDGSMCGTDTAYQLEATIMGTDNFTWITQFDGTFSDPTIVDPLYYPGEQEIAQGAAYPGVRITDENECFQSISDDYMVISITPLPTVEAGDDVIICDDESVTLIGSAQNNDSIIWTTAGDGSFSLLYSLQTVYTPGEEDVQNQGVVLYLEAHATETCVSVAIDSLFLYVYPELSVDAGLDTTICMDALNYRCSSIVNNATAVLWTSSGSGAFAIPQEEEAVYFPSQEDKSDGSVVLSIAATSASTCNTDEVSDSFTLTFQAFPVVEAGDDQTICSDDYVSLLGSYANADTVYWYTDGDGFFSDSSQMETIYYPGTEDVNAGSVVLQLVASSVSPCNAITSDLITISIDQMITVEAQTNATSVFPMDSVMITAAASDLASLTWQVINGNATLSTYAGDTTYYIPAISDTSSTIQIQSIATGLGTCSNTVFDTVSFQVLSPGAIDAGEDILRCNTVSYIPIEAVYPDGGTTLWTTLGDGTFSNPWELQSIYYPGTEDLLSGQVMLNIQDVDFPDIVEDSKLVTLVDEPTVSVSDSFSGCVSDTIQLSAEAESYAFVEWISTGDGSFADASSLSTVYYPGTEDQSNGLVQLSLVASGFAGCDSVATANTQLVLVPEPLSNAGSDQTICADASLQITDAGASNYSSLQWTSSGDGAFDDNTLLHPEYFPGTQDVMQGDVVLSLTSVAQEGCSAVSTDLMMLIIEETPQVYISDYDTSCYGATVQVVASAQHFSSISWFTNSDGVFLDNQGVTASYTPSENDLENEQVLLYAVASGTGNCVSSTDTSWVTIPIIRETTVEAGVDVQICENDFVSVYGYVTDFESGSALWTTSGDGIFANPLLFNTVYYPGTDDTNNGQVTLTLSATSDAPCLDVYSDDIEVVIQGFPETPNPPTAEELVCYGTEQVLLEVSPVDDAVSYNWFLVNQEAGQLEEDSIGSLNVLMLDDDFINNYYHVKVRAVNSCGLSDFSEAFNGFVKANPEVEIIVDPDTAVCFNQVVTLDATTLGIENYQWSPGSYGNTALIEVDSSGHVEGVKTITLLVTDSSGCQSVISQDLLFVTCTAVETIGKESLVIYPNPAKEKIYVNFELPAAITIYNDQGKLIHQQYHQFNGKDPLVINIAHYPAGMYFIKLKSNGGVISRSLMHIN